MEPKCFAITSENLTTIKSFSVICTSLPQVIVMQEKFHRANNNRKPYKCKWNKNHQTEGKNKHQYNQEYCHSESPNKVMNIFNPSVYVMRSTSAAALHSFPATPRNALAVFSCCQLLALIFPLVITRLGERLNQRIHHLVRHE